MKRETWNVTKAAIPVTFHVSRFRPHVWRSRLTRASPAELLVLLPNPRRLHIAFVNDHAIPEGRRFTRFDREGRVALRVVLVEVLRADVVGADEAVAPGVPLGA